MSSFDCKRKCQVGVNFTNVLPEAFTRKNDNEVISHFALLGSTHLKSLRKHVGEIDTRPFKL